MSCPNCTWLEKCNKCQELEKQTRLLEDQKREIEKARKIAEENRRMLKEQTIQSMKQMIKGKVERGTEHVTGRQKHHEYLRDNQPSESIQPVIEKIFYEIETLHEQVGNIYKELEELKRLYKKLNRKQPIPETESFFNDK